jgi:uncharacterized protein (DUF2132 family)
MSSEQPNNPLHGVTLKAIVEDLMARHGWSDLAELIPIRCFSIDPSVQSSLKFLRKTEWARHKVEQLYLADQRFMEREETTAWATSCGALVVTIDPDESRPDLTLARQGS